MNPEVKVNLMLANQSVNELVTSSDKFYERWIFPHSVLNVGGILIIFLPSLYPLWIGLIGLSFAAMVWNIKKSIKPLNFQPFGFGFPNFITTIRLIGLLWFAVFYQGYDDLTLFSVFTIVILLDGVDGFVARKLNQCSDQGEKLDAETDAQLVWLLSWIHFSSGNFDWWILIPGCLRYTYQLLFFWAPVRPNFPPKRFRATIAVIFFFSLSLAFVIPQPIATNMLAIAGCLIVCSFGLSLFGGLTSNRSRS